MKPKPRTGDIELDADVNALDPAWSEENAVYILGGFTADRLALISKLFDTNQDIADRLHRLSAHIRQYSDRRAKPSDLNFMARGLVRTTPLYALLLANNEYLGPLPGDGIRGLALICSLLAPSSAQRPSASQLKRLHPLVKARDRNPKPDAFDQALVRYLASPGDSLKTAVQEAAIGQSEIVTRVLPVLIKAHALLLAPVTKRKEPPKSIQFEPAETDDDNGFVTAREFGQHDEEASNESSVALPSLNASAFGRRVARLQMETAETIRSDALIPGSYAAIHDRDLAATICHLNDALAEASPSTQEQWLGSLILTLVLLCSKHRSSVLQALIDAKEGRQGKWLLRDRNNLWLRVVPAPDIEVRHSQPDSNLIRNRQPVTELRLPLPSRTSEALEIIYASEDVDLVEAAVQISIDKSICSLKSVVTYATEDRLKNSIPAACVALTEDPAMAMTISGSRCNSSSAPLAYYAPPVQQCHQVWARIVSIALPKAPPLDLSDRVGAPMGAVRDDIYQKVVAHFVHEAMQHTDDPVLEHDQICLYSARMWLATNGHRGQRHLEAVTYGDVDVIAGIGVTPDKPSPGMPSERPFALAEMLCVELASVRVLYERATNKPPTPDTPIFFLLGEQRAISSVDLAAPKEFDLPVHLFRSRLATKLRETLPPRLVYWQLGHIWLKQQPIEPNCSESFLESGRRVGKAVQKALEGDGWIALPKSISGIKSARTHWPADALGADLTKKLQIRRQIIGPRMSRPRGIESKNACHQWANAQLQLAAQFKPRSNPTKGFLVQKHHISRWHQASTENATDETEVIFRLIALRAKIKSFRHRFGWTGEVPVAPVPRTKPALWVAPEHIRAYRSSRVIREISLSAATWPTFSPATRAWARLAIFLVLDHVVVDPNTLDAVLTYISSPPTDLAASLVSAGRIEIRVSNDVAQLVLLNHDSATLASALADSASYQDLRSIKNAIAKVLKISPSRRKTHDGVLVTLFKLAALSRRVDTAGVHWERLDSGNHRTLDARAAIDDAYGICRGREAESHTSLASPSSATHGYTRPSTESEKAYQSLRLSVHRLKEPGATQQGLPSKRYKTARGLVNHYLSTDQPEIIHLLCRLLLALLGDDDLPYRLRISSIYGIVTTIGRRLVTALGIREASRLESADVSELYASVICRTPPNSRARTLSILRRFHTACEGEITDPDWSYVAKVANTPLEDHGNHISYVNEVEIEVAHRILDQLGEGGDGILEAQLVEYGHALIDLMYFGQLRPAEATHLRIRDVFWLNGRGTAWVIGSEVGLLKHLHSRRRVDLAARLGRRRSARLRTIQMRRRLSAADAAPLFETPHPVDLIRLLNVLREILAAATDDPDISLYCLRHGGISRQLSTIADRHERENRDQHLVLLVEARMRGQSQTHTAFRHYWHLAHTQANASSWAKSTEERAMLHNISPANMRQRLSRKKSFVPYPQALPAPGRAWNATPSAIAEVVVKKCIPTDLKENYWRFVLSLLTSQSSPRSAARQHHMRDFARQFVEELQTIEVILNTKIFPDSVRIEIRRGLGVRPLDSTIMPRRKYQTSRRQLRLINWRTLPNETGLLYELALRGGLRSSSSSETARAIAAAVRIATNRFLERKLTPPTLGEQPLRK